MTRIIVFFFLLTFGFSHSQELNCTVSINTQKLSNANQQVFKTLETSLNEFMNKTSWTNQVFNQNEKISCSMFITVSAYDSNQFTSTIQVQSSRLIYNSTYASPIFNFNDKDFSFQYTEFEALIFNPAEFESNLVSVLSFYAYIILGLDADSFVPMGGDRYYDSAQNIANVAQQSGYSGWNQSDGMQNRYFLIKDLVSPVYSDIRQSLFLYHSGLDLMPSDLKAAKEKIKESILNVGKLSSVKPNAFLTRVFFDAKADEIASIFSGGPSVEIDDLVNALNRASPLNTSIWAKISY